MIHKVSIRNFKSLRDVQVELERFTIFVGPNASGKSSVLQGLDLLCRMFQSQELPDESGVHQGVSRGAEVGVELAAESGDKWYRYRSHVISRGNGILLPVPGMGSPVREVTAAIDSADWTSLTWAVEARKPFPLSVLLRLEASKLILPDIPYPDPTVMAPDGTGMHAALATMALNDPDSWQVLQADLRSIIPTIRRLRHTKAQLNSSLPHSLLFDTLGADSLLASQVSEGTLFVLGLLTALHGPDRPNLILLDDLDRGLHPKAQKDLVKLLRGLLETNPDLQIVATTHSPYLLDRMQPNEVRMTCLRDDGATVCAPLEEHPKFEKWKNEMAPGEMWSLFGEKWLAEKVAIA